VRLPSTTGRPRFLQRRCRRGCEPAAQALADDPLPLGSGSASTPIDEALAAMRDRRGILTALGLPFRHSFAWLEDRLLRHPLAAAARMASLHADLLAGIGVTHVVREGLRYTSAPWRAPHDLCLRTGR
jgi:hypothetical protein